MPAASVSLAVLGEVPACESLPSTATYTSHVAAAAGAEAVLAPAAVGGGGRVWLQVAPSMRASKVSVASCAGCLRETFWADLSPLFLLSFPTGCS